MAFQIPKRETAVDLFCGCGGWGDHRGLDTELDVADTRTAAGLQTLVSDVSMVPRDVIMSTFAGVDGVIASPPCPPFSTAGTGEGVKDIATIVAAITCLGVGMDTRREHRAMCADPRSILSVEPLRWVLALRPQWTAWEQVKGALPIWNAAARILADDGYSVWVGVLDANDHGVAQNRQRAILMAHRTRLVSRPPRQQRLVMRDVITAPHPGAVLRMGRSRGTVRTMSDPAPTIMFGKSPNDVGWYTADGSRKITSLDLGDALVLQGFPADYPIRGTKAGRYGQVGDAVPPPMAQAILGELIS